jgi:DNA-binding SARP family transcriptional activator/TolB-like protein
MAAPIQVPDALGAEIAERPVLRVQLFGQMAVQNTAGKSLLPRARKTRALLAILALSAPRPVLRSQLTALLWSQREKEQARASLRQAVHELQETLGPAHSGMLCADRNHISLAADGLEIDALHLAQPSGMEEALDQFQNVLLEDLRGLDAAFDRWLEEERRRLVQIARTLGEGLLAEAVGTPAITKAANRLLMIDPAHEGAWRAIIRIHAQRGDRAAAIAAFERCRAALAETSQLQPSRETQELIAAVRSDAPGAEVTTIRRIPRVPDAALAPAARVGAETTRIGILPFRTIGAGEDDLLPDGLQSEIVDGLSRFRGISCVPFRLSPQEFFHDAGIAERLNLDFLVEGTIQFGTNRMRIMARLIDVRANGEVVWAARFDRPLTDTFTSQSEVASEIVAQIDPRLLLHQAERFSAQQTENLTPHELVVQSIPAIYRLERDAFHAAGLALRTAVMQAPDNAAAHAWLAYWNLFLVGQGWTAEPDTVRTLAGELATRAVTLDSGDARALTLAGHVRSFLGRHPEEGCTLHRRAISLNPNLALAWCFFGLAQCYQGRHDEALNLITEAGRLSPFDPHLFFFDMALTMPYLLRGEYEAVVEIGRRAIELNPGFTSSYKGHLSALGHLGRSQEAGRIRESLLVLEPDFTLRQARARSPMQVEADLDRYVEGLCLAGVPA